MSVIHEQIAALAGGGIEVVVCDPPWRFKSNSEAKPGKNAIRHYECMTLADIASIPVKATLAKNASCWMWIPPAFLAIGAHIPIMKAWGFEPSSIALTWVKSKRFHPWHAKVGEADLHFGTGLSTRKQCEVVVLGKRGRSLRVDGGVPEVIIAPVREHSRKPDQAMARIARYVGPGRRMVELFSRSGYPGFEPLGNQVGMFDEAAE